MRSYRQSKPMVVDPNLVFDYKEPAALARFITERGKIVGRSRTSLSAKRQRSLTKAIKRAHVLALLPFKS